ncbi:MAG TPA: hypothetical protein VN450_05515 [Candidatus Methylomirabilis sp.]|nr:hypothetical protein [Candidatus Methylomirabilis sp.]
MQVRGNGRSGRCATIVLLLSWLTACGGGADGQVVITGKTVYQGMAIEEVQVRVLRLDGDQWKESASGRSGYHGSFIVRTDPGVIRLEASGEIFKENRRIPLAGRVTALEVPSGVRRMDRIVIELTPVPDGRQRRSIPHDGIPAWYCWRLRTAVWPRRIAAIPFAAAIAAAVVVM